MERNKGCNCFTGKQQGKLAHDTWCKYILGKKEKELAKLAKKAYRTYKLFREELEELNSEAARKGYC